MSYKVIEKNEYGVLVIDNEQNQDIRDVCNKCKYLENCNNEWMKCIRNTYYIPDSEAAKLESENDLKAKNEVLKTRITELEEKCKSEYKRGVEDGKIIAEHGTTMYEE